MLSKHVDLIAVGALVLSFMIVGRAHQAARMSMLRAHVFNVRPMNPVIVLPPHVPALPRFSDLPRVEY